MTEVVLKVGEPAPDFALKDDHGCVRTQPWSSFNAKSGAGSPTFNTTSVIQNSSSQSSVCTLHTDVMSFMVQRTYTSLTALGMG